MNFQKIVYAILCFVLVIALMSFQPGGRGVKADVDVNEDLLAQAEAAGLLSVELPAGAESVIYNGCEVDGALTGEVYFTLNNVIWTYRCAAVDAAGEEIPDLSGMSGSFANVIETELQGRPAVISCTGGETGKIIWLDEATSLVYSLTMDSNAYGDVMQSIANLMFTPMQGNA